MRRRLAYLGTPEMAVPPLRALAKAGHEIALVITRADKRRGRGGETTPSPVKAAAVELGLPVSHSVDDLLGQGIELGVVVAFGEIIRPHVLAEVPMVNLHFSLLPRWRGAAPVERALLDGDSETGVCLMRVEEGLDTGPVYDTVRVPIGPRVTAAELAAQLVVVGTDQLVRCLGAPLLEPVAQVGEPVYAAKIRREELHIDWSQPAERIDRLVRLGGAWTTFRGKRVKVVSSDLASPEAGASGGAGLASPVHGLVVTRVQPEGRGPMVLADFVRGARVQPGETFV